MPPAIRRNSLDASSSTSPRSDPARNAAATSAALPSAEEISLEHATVRPPAGAVLPLAPAGVNGFQSMPPPVVFHLQSFLERPEVMVFSTASTALHAVTVRTPDPLLGAYFAAQRQVAAQPADPEALVPDELAQRLFALTRDMFAVRALPAAPSVFRYHPLFDALIAIVTEKDQRNTATRNRALAGRWLTTIASNGQAQLSSMPWEGDVIHDAVRSLCGLGRTREAEQVLRWRLVWRPADARAHRQLVDVLLQAHQYMPAVEAMKARNQLCANADRTTWVNQFELDGDTERADSILWANTRAPIAQALLLQGSAWGAYQQIDDVRTADPFTLAVIEHGLGHEAQAQAASARINDDLERALFHAWQGNAQFASKAMIAVLEEGGDLLTFRRILDVLHSPFLEPIRHDPHWQDFLSRFDLTPEQLARIPFDISPVDPECTRRAAELEILKHAEREERFFARNPGPSAARYLAIFCISWGRLEAAEQLLRWAIERSPGNWSTQEQLCDVLQATGRPDEALAQADIVNEMSGWGHEWDPRPRHLWLSEMAQWVYNGQVDSEHPNLKLKAMAAHTLGLHAERDALMGQLKSSLKSLATVHAWAGQADEAFECLHRMVATGRSYKILLHIVHSPYVEPLRSDPRWLVFLRSVNMAPEQLAAIPLRFELPPLPARPADGNSRSM